MASSYFELISKLETDLSALSSILEGDDNESVLVNGISKPSITKAIQDNFAALQAMMLGRTPFKTITQMNADATQALDSVAEVWGEPVAEDNGLYGWNGSAWLKSSYDPMNFSYLSENSAFALNAGFTPISSRNYVDRRMVLTPSRDSNKVNMVKNPTTDESTWFGFYIRIDYDSLEDLDCELKLNIDVVSGDSPGSFYIGATASDWGPHNKAHNIIDTDSINLYEIIQDGGTNIDYYTDAKELYIIAGKYSGDPENTKAATAEWNVSCSLHQGGQVIASELTKALSEQIKADRQAEINSAINTAVNGIAQPKAILKTTMAAGLISSNASFSYIYKNDEGQIFATESVINTVSVSYSYIGLPIALSYQDIANKRYRVYFEGNQEIDMFLRVTNAGNWGSEDGSVDSVISQAFKPLAVNGFSGYLDVDLLAANADDFYADPRRTEKQYVNILMGVEGQTTAGDLTLKVAIVDLDELDAAGEQMEFANPFVVLSDLLAKEVETTKSDLSELTGTVDGILEASKSTANAGVVFLDDEAIYLQSGRDMAKAGEIGKDGVTITHSPSPGPYSWFGIKVTVQYDSIEDLNKRFYLGFEHISGEEVNKFVIVNSLGGDWGPGRNAIHIPEPGAKSRNLYDDIMASNQDNIDYYSSANAIYITLARYSGDASVPPTMSSEWKVNPRFETPGAVVIASELSQGLQDSITQEIDDSLAESIEAGRYITCWGDSLTAGGGWTSKIQELSGYPVRNGGTGGETARTIVARQGADAMLINNITIPATTTPVLIADRDIDSGILTHLGYKVTPLLQGGSHINPALIGDVEGTLAWTGSDHSDLTGDWIFTRSEAGEEVEINRPTQIQTNFDRLYNGGIMVAFIGQNGGYDDNDDLVWQNRRMVEHSGAKKFLILGLSSGSAALRAGYEAAMLAEFGRRFVSLREYLAAPIYDVDGTTIVSCYGLDDAGLVPTQADLDNIATGTVPAQCLSDSVHYTTATKEVIGTMLYKRMVDLNFFK